MNTLRRLLSTLLALAFMVLCPLLVFHTLGYLNTGVVVVEAQPREASVWINDRCVAKETPATISHLPPGIYRLRLARPGYQEWSQVVRVVKGQAAVFDSVFLLPDDGTAETLLPGPFDTLLAVEGTPYIVLMMKGHVPTARVFNILDRKSGPLFAGAPAYDDAVIRQIFAVPGSPMVLARIERGDKLLYLWIDLDDDPPRARNLSALVPTEAEHILWSAQEPNQLFCFLARSVVRVNLEDASVARDFATGWVGLGVFEKAISGLDTDGRFVMKGFDGATLTTELTELDLGRRLFRGTPFIRILPMGDGSLLFHEVGGRLLQTELPHELAGDDIKGVRIAASDGRALVWRRHALGLLENRGREEEEAVFAAGREIRWIYEGGADVTSPHFLYEGTYAMCLLDATVAVFDLRDGASADPRNAIRVRKSTAIHYDDTAGMLYVLHPDDARLVGLRLLASGPDRSELSRPALKGAP